MNFDPHEFAAQALRKAQQMQKAEAPSPLAFIDMTDWDAGAPPERPWAVRDRIPLRQPTLFSGEGATEKALLNSICAWHMSSGAIGSAHYQRLEQQFTVARKTRKTNFADALR